MNIELDKQVAEAVDSGYFKGDPLVDDTTFSPSSLIEDAFWCADRIKLEQGSYGYNPIGLGDTPELAIWTVNFPGGRSTTLFLWPSQCGNSSHRKDRATM